MKSSSTLSHRKRPSQTRGFKLAVFSAGLLIFALSYWLGNRYQTPNIPGLTATLVHPAQKLPHFNPLYAGNSEAPPASWRLLHIGKLDLKILRRYAGGYNRLAHEPSVQKQFQVRFLSDGAAVLPAYAVQFHLNDADLDRLSKALGLSMGEEGLFLINPEGELTAVFSYITNPSVIAHDFHSIVNYFSP